MKYLLPLFLFVTMTSFGQDITILWEDSKGKEYKALLVLENHGGIENDFQKNEGFGRIVFEENNKKRIVHLDLKYNRYIDRVYKITEISTVNSYFLDTKEPFEMYTFKRKTTPDSSEFDMKSSQGVIDYSGVVIFTTEMRNTIKKLGMTEGLDELGEEYFEKDEKLKKAFLTF
ncbi:hypothetical protein [Cochleicola gelatinilyticus]|uniref:Uncharacterized protein n=1 Tax=Cochleicola gelatinilyticus TaxID=1763537 RepID=A0A167HSL5_9FLAO|nr:hypothetical protein [Cochleicola gelatinilyticus]OAB78920.1 hypothetical protein ULVI_10105 [Cochleicola gelatinilyticus]